MTRKATTLIGLPVMTLDSGKQVEKVTEPLYDPQGQKITGLLVEEGGWFKDAKVILFDDISSIGNDAVMIPSEQSIKKASDISETVSQIAKNDVYLTKNKIVTENGKELGTISDVFFDDRTGTVEAFEVSQGLKDAGVGRKRVTTNQIKTVGEDALIVSGFTEVIIENQEAQGGVVKAAQTAAQKGKAAATSVKDTAQEKFSQAKDSAQAAAENPENQAKMESAKMHASQAGESAKTKVQDGMSTVKDKASEFAQKPQVQSTVNETKSVAKDIGDIVKAKAQQARESLQNQAQEARQEMATSE